MAYINLELAEKTRVLLMTARVEDKYLTFMIDTGCNTSLLDSKVASALTKGERDPDFSDKMSAMGGTLECQGLITILMHHKLFTFEQVFSTVDLGFLSEALEQEVHGVLGTDFLIAYKCHIDFKKNRLHLG